MMSDDAPPPEPIEGDTEAAIDEDIIVEAPSHATVEISSDETSPASVTLPCAPQCCSLIWASSRKPNRDLAYLIQGKTVAPQRREPLSRRASSPLLFTSTAFNKSIPRGPPELEHC